MTADETCMVPLWEEVTGRRIRVQDGWLHYVDLGERGDPATPTATVVLLHKLGGWVADWRHVAELLAANYRVVAVDLPGHGGSTMDESSPWAHPPSTSARRIAELLAALGIERTHLMGNSLGGIVGVHLAVARPELVDTLALVGVSLTERHSLERTLDNDRAVRHLFGPGWEPLPLGSAAAERAGTDDPRILTEQDLSRAAAGRWVRPSERGVGLTGVAHLLSEVRVPTLVVNGVCAPYRVYDERARDSLADVRVVTVDEAGSFVHQERPADVARHWQEFVAEQSSEATAGRPRRE
ncbi:alpha/beta hydrolase [Rhodococcus sp. NPDC047139]|uniref:alpha/beta fold hydrolase n=1 Tax=Rhodococcus sp. NPDC047139 TaxID=3155141 RepID=UPI0033FA7556